MGGTLWPVSVSSRRLMMPRFPLPYLHSSLQLCIDSRQVDMLAGIECRVCVELAMRGEYHVWMMKSGKGKRAGRG